MIETPNTTSNATNKITFLNMKLVKATNNHSIIKESGTEYTNLAKILSSETLNKSGNNKRITTEFKIIATISQSVFVHQSDNTNRSYKNFITESATHTLEYEVSIGDNEPLFLDNLTETTKISRSRASNEIMMLDTKEKLSNVRVVNITKSYTPVKTNLLTMKSKNDITYTKTKNRQQKETKMKEEGKIAPLQFEME